MAFGYSNDGTTGGEVDCKTNQTVLTTGWYSFNCTFTTGTVSGTPYFYMKQPTAPGAARTVWIDAFQIVAGANIGAYGEGTLQTSGVFTAPLAVQTTSDSNTAFQVQSSDGTTVFGVDSMRRRVGIGTLKPEAFLHISSIDGTQIVQILRGGTAQSADLLQFQDVSGNVLTTFGADSSLVVKTAATTTTALEVQRSRTDSTVLLRVDTTNNIVKIGTTGSATLGTAKLLVTEAEVTTTLRIGDGTNGVSYNDGTSGKLRLRGTARNDIAISLRPEFDGLTLNGSGIGTLTSGFCSNAGTLVVNSGLCPNTGTTSHSYYAWNTVETNSQSYDMYVRYKLPSNFSQFFDDNTIKLWARRDTSSDSVTYQLYQADGTLCGTGNTTVTSSDDTWQQVSVNGNEQSTCSFAAGDTITFKISVTAQNGGTAWVGELDFTYKSTF
jgi:hypothetical protein